MYNSKSYININNYNKFLKKLENYNKNNKSKINNNKVYNKGSFNNTLNNIDMNYYYNYYNNIYFSGLGLINDNINNINNNNNPNNYKDENNINNIKQSNPFCNITNDYNNIIYNNINNKVKTNIYKDEITIKERIVINEEINNINDLLNLINKYPIKNEVEYNININILNKIKTPLEKLNSMIGMNKLKQNICDQLIYYLQNLNNKNNDYMHTIIYGPPGCGKSEIAKIIGELYSNVGILQKGTFKKVTRSDLIAGYLGQTALKTKEVINEAIGGVLFIDEVYSLGSAENRDSFSKECIDTLCDSLSEHKNDLMVIVAGYEKEINECFFNINKGLISRFNWVFKIDNYCALELKEIFEKKVFESGWSFSDDFNINIHFYENNLIHFNYFGRSIEVFFSKIKIAHSRRVFCLNENLKKKINNSDFNKGFTLFLEHKNENSDINQNKSFLNMYI